jgi:ribosomal protein L37AE/L43A
MDLPPPKPEQSKSCPVCLLAMRTTKKEGHTIYRCAQCGTVVMITDQRD